jgi:class 3 adenylate cyclase
VTWLPSLLWLAAIGLAVFNALFGFAFPGIFEAVGTDAAAGHAIFITVSLVSVGYATAGWIILRQRPRHAVGWIMLVAGPFLTAPFLMLGLGHVLVVADHPAAVWVILVASYIWVPSILLAGPILAMVFPDGRLPGPRWHIAMRIVVSVLAISLVAVVLRPGPVGGDETLPENPIGLDFVPSWLFEVLEVSGLVVLPTVLLLGVAAIVVRFRRSSGEEREQLKWFTWSVGLWGLTLPPSLFIESNEFFILAFGTLLLVPAAVVVAVTRYRLYDLDLILNRTIVYGAVTVVLAAAFGAANVLAQRGVESVFGERSDLVAGGLGVCAALAFGPMRRAIRPLVDRVLPARGRLTLLFMDVVESTQAIVDLGDARWRDVLARHHAIVRQQLSSHHGREVNTAGDGFFAVFDRPKRAVECALAIRAAVGELGLRVRTGLHIGDVEMRGEQVTGLAVHAAARVMAEAGADQVIVSSELAEQVHSEVALQELGQRALRGVPGEWRLYVVAG